MKVFQSNDTLAVHLHSNWTGLAYALDTKPVLIETIRRNLILGTITITDALHELLLNWRNRNAADAKLSKLLDILKGMRWQEAVGK